MFKAGGTIPAVKDLLLASKIYEGVDMDSLDTLFTARTTFSATLEEAIRQRIEVLKIKTNNEIEEMYELYIFVLNNPWNSNFTEYDQIVQKYPHRRTSQVSN